MKREAFFQNVKKAAFERVYFFYGPEEYVKASALAALRGAFSLLRARRLRNGKECAPPGEKTQNPEKKACKPAANVL